MSKNGLDAICAKLKKNAVKKEVERDYNFNEAAPNQEIILKKKNRRKTTVPRCLIPTQDNNNVDVNEDEDDEEDNNHLFNSDFNDNSSLNEYRVNNENSESITTSENIGYGGASLSSSSSPPSLTSQYDEEDNDLGLNTTGKEFTEMAESTVSEFLKKYGFCLDSPGSITAAINASNKIEDRKLLGKSSVKMEIDEQG